MSSAKREKECSPEWNGRVTDRRENSGKKGSIEIYNRKSLRDSRTKHFLSVILSIMNFRKLRKREKTERGNNGLSQKK